MSYKTPFLVSQNTSFHVYNRGVNRNNIFLKSDNYDYFLDRIQGVLDTAHLDIVAFCLMPNHFHFIFHQKIPYAIATYMKDLCDGYVKAVNKAYQRSGHLLGGSYKIKPVTRQSSLHHLSRYIHRNPVRSHLVTKPENWPYSSYRAYIGLESIR